MLLLSLNLPLQKKQLGKYTFSRSILQMNFSNRSIYKGSIKEKNKNYTSFILRLYFDHTWEILLN